MSHSEKRYCWKKGWDLVISYKDSPVPTFMARECQTCVRHCELWGWICLNLNSPGRCQILSIYNGLSLSRGWDQKPPEVCKAFQQLLYKEHSISIEHDTGISWGVLFPWIFLSEIFAVCGRAEKSANSVEAGLQPSRGGCSPGMVFPVWISCEMPGCSLGM